MIDPLGGRQGWWRASPDRPPRRAGRLMRGTGAIRWSAMSKQPSLQTHSIAVEDYIKHIWKLLSQGRRATTKAIAERTDLGRGTVSGMLKQLAARGLVEHQPYRGVKLTEAGERLALRIVRRHRLMELFLVRTLGLGWEQVHDDAERLEHAVSDELIEHIDRFLGHPQVDPHGAPIPNAAGTIERQDFLPLAELTAGEAGRVRRVSDHEEQFLKHLEDHGIALGARVQVVAVEPFGTLHVRTEKSEAHLAREAAQRIQVTQEDPAQTPHSHEHTEARSEPR